MSTVSLQRAVVRMLYDPAFVAHVFAGPGVALEGTGVDASERALLVAWDRRAFGTDAQRRTRTLAALMEEYPVASTLVLLRARSAAPLDAFFSSARFHACIQAGGLLAMEFGEYLREVSAPGMHVGAVETNVGAVETDIGAVEAAEAARLEQAIAGARRAVRAAGGRTAPAALPGEATYRLVAGVVVLEAAAGTLALQQAVSAAVAARSAAESCSLCDAIVAAATEGVTVPPLSGGAREHLLIHARVEAGSPVTAERIPEELARVLSAAAPGCSREQLLATLRAEGAEPGEDVEIVRSLAADGLLSVEDES